MLLFVFFFKAEDGIRDLVRSRGLGDVYKRQGVGLLIRDALESAMPINLEQFRISGNPLIQPRDPFAGRDLRPPAEHLLLSLIHI